MMSNTQPLISVGLPIYNRPEGLRNTLECFINQTYSNIEIIIADNCSPDPEVEKIAREYASKDSRISYYRHSSNKGWGYNTAFVIEKAQGDFFMRATDDDIWDRAYIEKVFALFFGGNEIIACMSNFEEVDVSGVKSKIHISDHLPLLNHFTTENQIQNIRNYISQYEGFGKALIYGAIIRTKYMKSDTVKKLMLSEFLAGDMVINLYLLLRGRLAVHPEILFRCTYDNVRHYDTKNPVSKKADIGILVIDYGIVRDTYRKWNRYFYKQMKIIHKSEISLWNKLILDQSVIRRLFLFYYDLMCTGLRMRGYDMFKKMRRKYYLS